MKRVANIIFLVLSVLLILTVPFIPHHHHENVECVVIEHCISNTTTQEEHTEHNERNGSCKSTSCTIHIQSLKAQSCINKVPSAFQFLYTLLPTFGKINLSIYLCENTLIDRYMNSYHYDAGKGFKSLRAPPC